MKNIFLKKLHIKYGGETIPRPFSKKSKLSISLEVKSLKFYILCFLWCAKAPFNTKLKNNINLRK